MNRRDASLALLATGAMPLHRGAHAQQARKVATIGYLSTPTRESVREVLDALLRALAQLGWIEGQNLIVDYRWAEGRPERLDGLAANLVARKVDLILAPATSAALAAQRATRSIPIVMIFPNDPVAAGLVASLRRPGGNVTGTTFTAGTEIFAKQLQILREVVPSASRIGVLTNPMDRNLVQARELDAAAPMLGLRLHEIEARGPEDFEAAFAAMAAQRTEALVVSGSSTLLPHRKRLADLAARARLPTMLPFREMVEAGGLMAYGIDMRSFVVHAAGYVDKILRGTKPADLPVEQPKEFELVINLKTARLLGLTIPASALARADVLIR